MKKHAEQLKSIASDALAAKVVELQGEIANLRKGIRLGDVQNYKMLGIKRKELARVLTRIADEEKEIK